jgi:hypothetical protein
MVGIAFRSSGVTHDVQPYCRMDRAQKTGALPRGPVLDGRKSSRGVILSDVP